MASRRTALVTGAASGIGRAVAGRLGAAGWAVAVLDVNADAAEAAADELGATAFALPCDVSDPAAVEAAVAELGSRVERLEALVGVAGVEVSQAIATHRAEEWDRVLGINLTGQFLCMRFCAELLGRGRASIVCIGSPLGRAAYPNASAYAASKAGLEGLVRAAAVEWAPRGVRVNCVLPGTTDTPLLRGTATGPALERLLTEAAESVPLGRVAQPAEIAGIVEFLLSEDASYITGASIAVDGGLLAALVTDI
jgi:NAD(P)-dependent dehydrogenase (short-subunit alcohol dehydrogenase family)